MLFLCWKAGYKMLKLQNVLSKNSFVPFFIILLGLQLMGGYCNKYFILKSI